MASRAAELVAEIIDGIEGRPYETGRPPLPTVKVVEALRFFVREGVQWRELRATADRACGSTLRRRLDEWGATALLRRVHVALVRMVRAGPGAASSLHEGSVVKRAGASFTSFQPCEHRRLGSGAVPRRSHGCVTLHAVGPGPRSRTRMPLARGAAPARRDPPGTRRRIATFGEDGRAPRAAAGGRPRGGGLVCYAATSTPSGTRPVSA